MTRPALHLAPRTPPTPILGTEHENRHLLRTAAPSPWVPDSERRPFQNAAAGSRRCQCGPTQTVTGGAAYGIRQTKSPPNTWHEYRLP